MKTALPNGFLTRHFENDDIINLKRVVALASKCDCGTNVSTATVQLPSIHVVYQTEMLQVTLESARRDYAENRAVSSSPTDANGEADADKVRLKKLVK